MPFGLAFIEGMYRGNHGILHEMNTTLKYVIILNTGGGAVDYVNRSLESKIEGGK